jgi:hypothetical protein
MRSYVQFVYNDNKFIVGLSSENNEEINIIEKSQYDPTLYIYDKYDSPHKLYSNFLSFSLYISLSLSRAHFISLSLSLSLTLDPVALLGLQTVRKLT